MKKKQIKYLSIYRDLKDKLENKDYKPYDFIPNEEDFCRIYSVCRPTMAKALDILVKEKRLKRIKGKGTMVLGGPTGNIPRNPISMGIIIPRITFINHTRVLFENTRMQCEARSISYIVAEPYTIENMLNQMIQLSHSVNGLIVYAWTMQMLETIRELRRRNVPLVVINNYFQDEPVDSVIPDFYKAAYIATEHLIKTGHRMIAHITQGKTEHKIMSGIDEFTRGYRQALLDYGIPFKSRLLAETPETNENMLGGYSTAKSLFMNKNGITAVVTFNDMIAVGVLKALDELKIKAPEDVSVVGFGDDLELHGLYGDMACPLSTVSANREILGFKAVDCLRDRIYEEKASPFRLIRVEPSLIWRKTTRSATKLIGHINKSAK